MGNVCRSPRSINPRKWLDILRAKARSRTRSPTSILRSSAASVRLAEVTKTTSSSATAALAWSTAPGRSGANAGGSWYTPGRAEPGQSVDRHTERLRHAVGGDVTVGRSDPAGGEDIGAAMPERVECVDDRSLLVADHPHFLE